MGFEQSEPGLERGRTLGAGARTQKMESEPGPELRRWSRSRGPELGRWSRSRGPNSEDGVGAGARTQKMSRSRGPNSEDGVGTGARTQKMESEPGAREKESEPGPELGRWSGSRGPREDRCSKEYEHEEEEGLRRA